jgi:hypothetical protein
VGAGCPAVAVLRSVQGGAPDRVEGFELAYVTRDGEQARVALAEAWSLRLERAEPVRRTRHELAASGETAPRSNHVMCSV